MASLALAGSVAVGRSLPIPDAQGTPTTSVAFEIIPVNAEAGVATSPEDIAFVQGDMRDDPFLSRARPRCPYFTPAFRGRQVGLESSTRYA